MSIKGVSWCSVMERHEWGAVGVPQSSLNITGDFAKFQALTVVPFFLNNLLLNYF